MTAEWEARAACVGVNPKLFDTAAGATTVRPAAATWCRICPVRQLCLEKAMDAEGNVGPQGRFGIFGGKSPRSRWLLHRYRTGAAGKPSKRLPDTGIAPCGTPAAYRRHKRRGEPIDEACDKANRRNRQERNARGKAAA